MSRRNLFLLIAIVILLGVQVFLSRQASEREEEHNLFKEDFIEHFEKVSFTPGPAEKAGDAFEAKRQGLFWVNPQGEYFSRTKMDSVVQGLWTAQAQPIKVEAVDRHKYGLDEEHFLGRLVLSYGSDTRSYLLGNRIPTTGLLYALEEESNRLIPFPEELEPWTELRVFDWLENRLFPFDTFAVEQIKTRFAGKVYTVSRDLNAEKKLWKSEDIQSLDQDAINSFLSYWCQKNIARRLKDEEEPGEDQYFITIELAEAGGSVKTEFLKPEPTPDSDYIVARWDASPVPVMIGLNSEHLPLWSPSLFRFRRLATASPFSEVVRWEIQTDSHQASSIKGDKNFEAAKEFFLTLKTLEWTESVSNFTAEAVASWVFSGKEEQSLSSWQLLKGEDATWAVRAESGEVCLLESSVGEKLYKDITTLTANI